MTPIKELPPLSHSEPDALLFSVTGLLAGTAAYLFLGALIALSGLGANYQVAIFWACIAAGLFLSCRDLYWVTGFKAIAALLIIYLLHNALVDTSYDGRTYHLPVSIELAKGLNLFLDQSQSQWGNIYPSGSWRIHAALSSVGIGLHSGFFLNSCLLIASYIVTEHATRGLVRGADQWRKFLCLMVAFSPVVAAQLSTALVDGTLGSLHLILVMAGYLFARTPKLIYLILFISAGVFSISVKTSGVYFFAISAFAVCAILVTQRSPSRWLTTAQLIVALFAALIVAVVANYKPMVTNISKFGSPLPDTGPIMKGNKPDGLQGQSRIYQVSAAVFTRVGGNVCCTEPLSWKIPGSFDLNELKSAKAGPRTGGFGPFYGLILLAGIASLVKLRTENKPDWLFIGMIASGVVSCVLFPEPWWARYVPFIGCLAPLLMIAAGWNPTRRLQIFVAALMSFNALVFVANEVSANLVHHSAERELRRLSAENEVVIGIGGGQAIFLEYYLRMKGIPAAVGTCTSATAYFVGLPVCHRPLAKALRPAQG